MEKKEKKEKKEKNILLSYLSNVKVKRDHTGLEKPSNYPDLGIETYTTNESAAYYLKQDLKNGGSIDKFFIFASKEVREVLQVPEGEPGYGMTHLEFYRDRLIKDGVIHQATADEVLPLPESEKDKSSAVVYCGDIEDGTDYVMQSVLQMAGLIAEYQKKEENAGNTVKIHLDITGGPRNSIMMALAIMRLMEYRGVRPGRVLYSSWKDNKGKVLDVSELYAIFDLISGAGEFKNYGSVKTLNAYFDKREKSEPLQEILDKMDGFAKDIQISNRKQFQNSISQLSDALKTFKSSTKKEVEVHQQLGDKPDKKELNDLKFQILTRPIEREYKKLIHAPDELSELSYIDYIEWCLDHSYVQQALTLYTETVPDFILKQSILYFTDKQSKELDEVMKSELGLIEYKNYENNLMFFFINQMNEPDENSRECSAIRKYLTEFCRELRRFISTTQQEFKNSNPSKKKGEKSDGYFTEEHYQEAVQDMMELLNSLVKGHIWGMSEVNKNWALSMMKAIWEIGKNPGSISSKKLEETLQNDEFSCLSRLFHDKIMNRWGKDKVYGVQRYKSLLEDLSKAGEKNAPIKDSDLSSYFLKGLQLKDNLQGRPKEVYRLICAKKAVLGTNITMENIVFIVNDYRILKDVRNDTAHAKLVRTGRDESGKEFTADTVTEYIKDSIDLLRQCAERANG